MTNQEQRQLPWLNPKNAAMAKSELNTKEQLESIWRLGGLRPKALVYRVWNAALDNNLLGRGSELAYNFIFSLFPLLLFVLSLFGLFAGHAIQLRNDLMFYLARALPPAAFQVVSHTVEEVARGTSGGKLTFGIVLTLWAAAGGMASMISTLNAVYGVREGRSWWKVRVIAVALTVAVSALVILALGVVVLGGVAAAWAGSNLRLGIAAKVSWMVLQWPLALLFIVIAFSLIYYFAPDLKEQHWYWITPGSLFGVLMWLAVSFGFRAYLHFFNSYSKTYGSLGAVIILLIWFYVTGLAFLAGSEINAQIEHAAAEHGHPEAKAEGQKKAA